MLPVLFALFLLPSFDDAVRASLERNHVPGAVIAVVRQGASPAVTAYGSADLGARTPVEVERTSFRTASVSKVITAAVVARLIDAGKLDPAADVNRYLDFTIPPYGGKAVTLAHLLTHTAGFDDRYAGKSARTSDTALSLGRYVRRWLPSRIIPPGEVFIYSNYGIALAGYIAERVSRKPFAELARDSIFQPLGMTTSSFVPAKSTATPYEWTGSGYRALPLDYLQDAPAGMQTSSGADMARFLQWTLDHSSRPEFQPQFKHDARLEGAIGWAWDLGLSHGHAFAGHDGGYPGAVARVRFFPKDGAGYFIAANALSGAFLGEVSALVEQQLLDELRPAALTRPVQWDTRIGPFAGTYRDVRYSHHTLLKVGVLLGFGGGELTIGPTADGLITMPKLDGSPRRMAQVAPAVFQSLDDDYFCSFRRDSSGHVTHLFTSGITALERVPWLLSAPLQRNIFLLCALTLVLLIVAPTRRWLLPEPLRPAANWCANAFGFQLLGLGIVLGVLPSPEERAGGYMYGFPWPIWIAQTLGVAGAACVIWLLVRVFRLRPRRPLPWLAATMLVVYTMWLWHWRLLGYWF